MVDYLGLNSESQLCIRLNRYWVHKVPLYMIKVNGKIEPIMGKA